MSQIILNKGEFPLANLPIDSKPYIFWDTCALINLMSINARMAFNEFEFYNKLYGLIANNTLGSVTSAIVYREFSEHIEKAYDDDKDKEDNARNCFLDYAETLPETDKNKIHSAIDHTEFFNMRLDILRVIWNNTYTISEDDTFMHKAHDRVLKHMCPAHVKGEYKDCYIWETYLDFLSRVSNAAPCFFFSVNTEDFAATKKSKDPNPMLIADCAGFDSELYMTVERAQVGIYRKLGLL